MMTKDDGGPAFPLTSDAQYYGGGMTLRDWFAGQALKAIVGAVFVADIGEEDDECADALSAHDIARAAYDVASAMLAVREAHQ